MLSGKFNIGTKFGAAFVAIIAIFLGISSATFLSLKSIEEADAWNTHTYKVLGRASLLLSSVVNQETGVRGFLVSGDENFLEPYIAGDKTFQNEIEHLLRLTSDNPAQQERLRRIKHFEQEWRTTIAEREIALMRNAATQENARALEASGAGKDLMDQLRGAHAEFDQAERSLLEVRTAKKAASASFAYWAIGVGAGFMLLFAIAVGWLLTRNIASPIVSMTSAMRDLTQGKTDITIPATGRKDEIGAMASALQVFKTNAQEVKRLTAEQEAARAAKEQEQEATRAQELAFQQELDVVTEAASKGDFSRRIATDDQDSAFLNIANRINGLIDTVGQATGELGIMLAAMADGDLTKRITANYKGKFAELKDNANHTAEQLTAIVGKIRAATGEVENAASEISTGTQDLSSRTEQAASSLEETAASTDEMAATVKQNAENATKANEIASDADRNAKSGGDVVGQAVNAMAGIEQFAQKITDIISVIDEIAFQTNLLALNASVEAARAGEAGKGFAVVAQEVRQLAQRSAQAASDIKTLIQDSNGQVKDGVQLVNKAGEALAEIVGSIGKVTEIVGEISNASQEQAIGVQEINSSVTNMDEMTQQNSALVGGEHGGGSGLERAGNQSHAAHGLLPAGSS